PCATLSLHDALPIWLSAQHFHHGLFFLLDRGLKDAVLYLTQTITYPRNAECCDGTGETRFMVGRVFYISFADHVFSEVVKLVDRDRKSTRLNSSHVK